MALSVVLLNVSQEALASDDVAQINRLYAKDELDPGPRIQGDLFVLFNLFYGGSVHRTVVLFRGLDVHMRIGLSHRRGGCRRGGRRSRWAQGPSTPSSSPSSAASSSKKDQTSRGIGWYDPGARSTQLVFPIHECGCGLVSSADWMGRDKAGRISFLTWWFFRYIVS